MIKPSKLFSKIIEKHVADYDFYSIPQPNLYTEYDVTCTNLSDIQDEFYGKLEQWILKNEKIIISYIKQKRKQDLDAAQEKFNSVKEL